MKNKIVCLLTDFGGADTYAGVMKGILLAQVPSVQIVDLTHGIPPQDVRAAAFELMTSVSDFPPGTFFISVVDPGVGSQRKILYAEAGGWRFMAPDNGLLSWIFERTPPTKLIAVDPNASLQKAISRTFHGRDIFAPVAARLLKGEPPSKIGRTLKQWIKLSFPKLKKTGSQWKGEVLHVDNFGNLITNFPSEEVQPFAKNSKLWFELGENPLTIRGLVHSYSEVEKGKLLAIPGSAGFIEISMRDGNASQVTSIKTGSTVCLHLRV